MNAVKRLRTACYTTNITMSIVGNLPPLLFLTFRSMYGLSYSLLGTLVLINFCAQLAVDLVFSFFSHRFNIPLTVKLTPAFSLVGFLLYALAPVLFPNAVYAGLVLGTVVFSAGSGLAEVLISPVIAALPSDNPDRDMSALHSIYAWGVVGVVIFSTLFLLAFGGGSWQVLMALMMVIPLFATILFSRAQIPPMETPEKLSGALAFFKKGALWLCVAAIFLGGASEVTMAQWASSYLEQAIGISKVWGDVFGVALFGMTLGIGRTMYARIGKNITRVLVCCGVGATVCYLTTVLSSNPVIGLMACALTGLCTSMMWPGSLIVGSDRFPTGGVFMFALMAAGGDLGASVGPQMVGMITDAVIASPALMEKAAQLALSPEQMGMKVGMLAATAFPALSIVVYTILHKTSGKKA